MNLHINGEDLLFEVGLTVGQLLEQLQLQPECVVLELNKNILNTIDNINTLLQDNDSLEIVQFVGGG